MFAISKVLPATAARPAVGGARGDGRVARRSIRVAASEKMFERVSLGRASSYAGGCTGASTRGDLASTRAMSDQTPETPDSSSGNSNQDTPGTSPTGGRQNYAWNAEGWEQLVKIAYAAVAALICNNILFECFPYGIGTPPSPPGLFSCEFAEMLVMFSGVLLGAFDFGPQCGAQIRGGLKALDVSVSKQRQAASDFLGLVLLKILSDGLGLALLAAPAFLLPDWLPRSVGIGVALLGRSVFVEKCAQTFTASGAPKPVPADVRAVIGVFDRTLAFMALSVAYGTYSSAPYVAVPSAILFFLGASYFAFGEKLLGKK
jgi:hypothetical protein